MIFKASDELNWEPPNPHLTYEHNKENDQLCKTMVAMNYTSSAIDEEPNEVTAIDAAKLISERHSYCEFTLNINTFNYCQQKFKEIQTQIEKEIKKKSNSTLYTTKEVEGVDLIHKIIKYSYLQYSKKE